jgi:HEPN domain-containing protein
MKPETEEWVDKAEGNWLVANRELQVDKPVLDVVCFLAQQCAEHYLKAFLEERNIPFPKTHDLVVLHQLSGGLLGELDAYQNALRYVSTLGIAARYPGMRATDQITQRAIRLAGEVRSVIRLKFGLS